MSLTQEKLEGPTISINMFVKKIGLHHTSCAFVAPPQVQEVQAGGPLNQSPSGDSPPWESNGPSACLLHRPQAV
jgi:hypothetical protein